MEYFIPKINILSILSFNYNNNNMNRNLILEPFCCILRIILLNYKPIGTKISIQNNSIQYYDPSIYQGILRSIYGDNREDIHNLYSPIFFKQSIKPILSWLISIFLIIKWASGARHA